MAVGRACGVAISLALWAGGLSAQAAPSATVGRVVSVAALQPMATPLTQPVTQPAAPATQPKLETTSTVVKVRSVSHPAKGFRGKLIAGLESPQLYHVSQGMLLGASTFDLAMTATGMSHPSTLHLTVVNAGLTRTVNLNMADRFEEGGWARVVSARNPAAVCAVYATADALMALAARRLARQGGHWRALASVGMLAESVVHIEGGATWAGLPNRLAAPYGGFNPVWVP